MTSFFSVKKEKKNMNKRFAIVVLLIALTSLCLAAINLNNSLNLLDKKDKQ